MAVRPEQLLPKLEPATNSAASKLRGRRGVRRRLAASRCNWRAWSYDPDTNTHWVTTSAECLDASLSTIFGAR